MGRGLHAAAGATNSSFVLDCNIFGQWPVSSRKDASLRYGEEAAEIRKKRFKLLDSTAGDVIDAKPYRWEYTKSFDEAAEHCANAAGGPKPLLLPAAQHPFEKGGNPLLPPGCVAYCRSAKHGKTLYYQAPLEKCPKERKPGDPGPQTEEERQAEEAKCEEERKKHLHSDKPYYLYGGYEVPFEHMKYQKGGPWSCGVMHGLEPSALEVIPEVKKKCYQSLKEVAKDAWTDSRIIPASVVMPEDRNAETPEPPEARERVQLLYGKPTFGLTLDDAKEQCAETEQCQAICHHPASTTTIMYKNLRHAKDGIATRTSGTWEKSWEHIIQDTREAIFMHKAAEEFLEAMQKAGKKPPSLKEKLSSFEGFDVSQGRSTAGDRSEKEIEEAKRRNEELHAFMRGWQCFEKNAQCEEQAERTVMERLRGFLSEIKQEEAELHLFRLGLDAMPAEPARQGIMNPALDQWGEMRAPPPADMQKETEFCTLAAHKLQHGYTLPLGTSRWPTEVRGPQKADIFARSLDGDWKQCRENDSEKYVCAGIKELPQTTCGEECRGPQKKCFDRSTLMRSDDDDSDVGEEQGEGKCIGIAKPGKLKEKTGKDMFFIAAAGVGEHTLSALALHFIADPQHTGQNHPRTELIAFL